MLVACNLNALLYHYIVYKLAVLWVPSEQNFLHHMVSIDILGKLPDLRLHEAYKELILLRKLNGLYYLLNRAGPVGVSAKSDYVFLDLPHYLGQLRHRASFNELLG
jgi:hypothetical protein